MSLNKTDRKDRKTLINEAHELYNLRNRSGFFKTCFDIRYEAVIEKIRDLDIKSLRDSLSEDNPYYKCSK